MLKQIYLIGVVLKIFLSDCQECIFIMYLVELVWSWYI